jgi:hypothetical protein
MARRTSKREQKAHILGREHKLMLTSCGNTTYEARKPVLIVYAIRMFRVLSDLRAILHWLPSSSIMHSFTPVRLLRRYQLNDNAAKRSVAVAQDEATTISL